MSGVPRVVHQIWLQGVADAPPDIQDAVTRAAPHWGAPVEWWDERSIRALIKTEYAHLLRLYDSLHTIIERADLGRALILHARGGVYADADYVPHATFGSVWRVLDAEVKSGRTFGVPRMCCGAMGWLMPVNNAWMWSAPREPFWLAGLVAETQRALAAPRLADILLSIPLVTWPVLTTTGPVALWRALRGFESRVDLMPHAVVFEELGTHGSKAPRWFSSRMFQARLWMSIAVIVLLVVLVAVCVKAN